MSPRGEMELKFFATNYHTVQLKRHSFLYMHLYARRIIYLVASVTRDRRVNYHRGFYQLSFPQLRLSLPCWQWRLCGARGDFCDVATALYDGRNRLTPLWRILPLRTRQPHLDFWSTQSRTEKRIHIRIPLLRDNSSNKTAPSITFT